MGSIEIGSVETGSTETEIGGELGSRIGSEVE